MKRGYLLFLQDILRAIQSIEEFVAGMDFDVFAADDRVKSAVVWKLVTIGEAAKNIPAQVRKRHAHIPWSSMAKMRDRLAHGYFVIDDEVVWQVIREELPALKPQIQKAYEHERQNP